MKLFMLSQDENNDYDTFDSCVVVAVDAEQAGTIHPQGGVYPHRDWDNGLWAKTPASVNAVEIGTPKDGMACGTVVIASFNAG